MDSRMCCSMKSIGCVPAQHRDGPDRRLCGRRRSRIVYRSPRWVDRCQGMAEATGRKVVAVSNLQALASLGTLPLRAVVIDARRGDIYGAVYDAALNPVSRELVIKYDDWLGPCHHRSRIHHFRLSDHRRRECTCNPSSARPGGGHWKNRSLAIRSGTGGGPLHGRCELRAAVRCRVFWKDTGVALAPHE